nr:MAG TPA: ECL1/2/3 zinc binding protein [Caudoviricetes sp.]
MSDMQIRQQCQQGRAVPPVSDRPGRRGGWNELRKTLVALREMTAPLSPLERLLAGIDDGAAKTQTCRWCGTVFLVTNRNKAYCSDECRKAQNDAWGRERKARGGTLVLEARPCVVCGAVFMPKVVQQITCSPECSRLRRHEMAKDLRQRARERQKCAKKKEDA